MTADAAVSVSSQETICRHENYEEITMSYIIYSKLACQYLSL